MTPGRSWPPRGGNIPVGNPRQDFIDAVSEMTPAERAATWATPSWVRSPATCRSDLDAQSSGSLRRHPLQADEAAGELDLAHVAQAVLVDPALGRVEERDALGSRDPGAVGARDLRRERVG